MKKILFCFGTRPEAIKMFPLIQQAAEFGFEARVCLTGQHKEMILPLLEKLNITYHHDLDLMQPNQSLNGLTSRIFAQIDTVLNIEKPDFVFVQGDTTSTFACGLASFHQKIPVVHVEAGLRTFNMYSPFPEEINRQMVSTFASFHFAPTTESLENLQKEGRSNAYVVGNTSLDALRLVEKDITPTKADKKRILVTCHRRENHGKPFEEICEALLSIAEEMDVEIIYPVHLNPNIKNIAETMLKHQNIKLIPPQDYFEFIKLMKSSDLIISDSGGVQEEAPFFKKPVLILRENTERPEVVSRGLAKLVGHDKELILAETRKLLTDSNYYQSFQQSENPYGDGHASEKIFEALRENS